MAVKDADRIDRDEVRTEPDDGARRSSGYDAETGKLVAAALGVEPCFVATPFEFDDRGGSWGDRSTSPGAPVRSRARMTRLYVTQPYYATPASSS